MQTVQVTRYITPFREGGSMPGLMEADDEGLYVVKFSGAGQGRLALVAEVIGALTAKALGFLVPDLVIAHLDIRLAAAEPDPDIQDLLKSSGGSNLGVDFLPGSLPFAMPVSASFASDLVWFDALITNVDRTVKNPNLLLWQKKTWLIDHGAALIAHHRMAPLIEAVDLPFPQIADHILLPFATSIRASHERLSSILDRSMLTKIVSEVPEDWFVNHSPEDYIEYLTARIKSGAFALEAERART
jgi:hypothetical protein